MKVSLYWYRMELLVLCIKISDQTRLRGTFQVKIHRAILAIKTEI